MPDPIADTISDRLTPTKFVCPACNQKAGVDISYGYPSPIMWDQAERGEAVLGGCMQEIGAPDRQCLDCNHQWEIVRRKPSMDTIAATD